MHGTVADSRAYDVKQASRTAALLCASLGYHPAHAANSVMSGASWFVKPFVIGRLARCETALFCDLLDC